jgi:protein-S-isoprenylcysteine O-methyltransferase Ste14
MEKLNFLGVGPKIGRIVIPYLAITITLTILFPEKLTFGIAAQQPLLIAGIILLAIALMLYIATLRLMLPGIRNNLLVTGGTYRLCRNPLYAALILFLIPGLALVLNSWIVLTTSIVGYLLFRRFVHEEEELLERIFGEDFRRYRESTSCFFPFPFPKK